MNSKPLRESPGEVRSDATAKDVAEAAGVSRIMVSRAFNPNASVRADKRAAILSVAERLGYHPDMAARSMVTGRTNLVAILVPALSRAWESQEVDALIAALQRQGLAALVFRVSTDEPVSAGPLQVRAYKPAAVVAFMDLIAPSELIAMFGNSPAIYPYYGLEPPRSKPDLVVDRLHINQHAGIRSAVKLLVGAGKRRIVYLAGSPADMTGRAENANSDHDRFSALTTALAVYGIGLEARLQGDFDYDTARQQVINYLRGGGEADAFFAANDSSAFGAMDAVRYDLKRTVPEQISVVGFDNVREAGWRAYDLTTIGVPIETRVAALMRLLKARLSGPKAPGRVETVTASLIVRSSA